MDQISDNHLDALLKLIKDYELKSKLPQRSPVLATLRKIKIGAPIDFLKIFDTRI